MRASELEEIKQRLASDLNNLEKVMQARTTARAAVQTIEDEVFRLTYCINRDSKIILDNKDV